MVEQTREIFKQRVITFSELHPDPNQAETASLVLKNLPGIEQLQAINPGQIRIDYNVLEITLQQIESILTELGFHLDGSLINRLKRSLHYYTEETQRANSGIDYADGDSTQKVFIERYSRISHGCQDGRPDIWRHYR